MYPKQASALRAPFQYPIRRLTVRSRKVSKPWDLYLELSDRSEIWQAPRQQGCRIACQISKRCDNLNYQSRGFEISRDLTIRRLIGYWNGAQVSRVRWDKHITNTNSQWCSAIPRDFGGHFGWRHQVHQCNMDNHRIWDEDICSLEANTVRADDVEKYELQYIYVPMDIYWLTLAISLTTIYLYFITKRYRILLKS